MGKTNAHRPLGFTLVEVMIAVMIIGLLAAMATPAVLQARDRAQRSVCRSNLRVLTQAAETYALEKGATAGITLEDIRPYMAKERLPACPANGTYSIQEAPVLQAACTVEGHRL